MLTDTHLEFVRDRGSKFGRFLMGFLFFASGLSMLYGFIFESFYFNSLPIPGIVLYASLWTNISIYHVVTFLVIVLKVVAGFMLMIGRYVPISAATLILFTLIATLLAHMSAAVDPSFPTGLLKNLAIVGGLLYVMAFGPGGVNLTVSSEPKGHNPELS